MDATTFLEQYRRIVGALTRVLPNWDDLDGDTQLDLAHELVMTLGQRASLVERCERARDMMSLSIVLRVAAVDMRLVSLSGAILESMDIDVRSALAPESVSVSVPAPADAIPDDDVIAA